MDAEWACDRIADIMAEFLSYMAKHLPDDIYQKLKVLSEEEDGELASVIFDTMAENQELADKLDRPCCQDTGVIQFFIHCGSSFPYTTVLEQALNKAVRCATMRAPLRHNCVETFEEYNTGNNMGRMTPNIFWEMIPEREDIEIDVYMAGGGCTLPGRAKVLMPGEGYEGISRFVFDTITEYGLNACPPLLVGVGIATSAETAALLSKKALMRPIGSKSTNEKAAEMEVLLEAGLNEIGLGPQGMTGKKSVMGVHIEHAARHPSTIGVGVNVGCWSHRRGHINFNGQLDYQITSHSEVTL